MALRYTEDAIKDLDDILDFIADDSSERALAFVAKIKSKIELLADFPALGVSCQGKGISENCRVMIYKSYLIFYSVNEEEILILNIINAAEDYTR